MNSRQIYTANIAWCLLALSGGHAHAQPMSTYALEHGGATDTETRRALQWSSDGTEKRLTPALRSFFGQTTGRYLSDADQFPKANGEPLISAQVLRIFGDLKLNDFSTIDGYRVLVSAESREADQRTYVVTVGHSTRVAAVGLTYFNCPPGGYVATVGVWKGEHKSCESDPTLVIFYPQDSAGNVERIAAVDKAILGDVNATVAGWDPQTSEDGKQYHLKVVVRGVKSDGSS